MAAKRLITEWWTAVLADDRLLPARGCIRKVKHVGSNDETATRESHRSLTANIGDKLMLFGASLEQIQIVEVRWIKINGWTSTLFVNRGAGAVNDGPVHVLKLKPAKEVAQQ